MRDDLSRETLQKAFCDTPPSFRQGVEDTLWHLTHQKEEVIVKKKISLGLAIALILVAVCGVVYAAVTSQVADIFGWLYGNDMKEELLAGNILPVGQTVTVGDVEYTLEEVVYGADTLNGGYALYCTGYMRLKEGAEAVLMQADDYEISDPYGYLCHYQTDFSGNQETVPPDAKTYADVAREKGRNVTACIIRADKLVINGVTYEAFDAGYASPSMGERSFQYSMELYPQGDALPKPEEIKSVSLTLTAHNWEITPDGEYLRTEKNDPAPGNTWISQEWQVDIIPTVKE